MLEKRAMIKIDGWKSHIIISDILNSTIGNTQDSSLHQIPLRALNVETSNFTDKNLWVFYICMQKVSSIEWKLTKL